MRKNWQLFDNFLATFWQLFGNFLATFWQTFWQILATMATLGQLLQLQNFKKKRERKKKGEGDRWTHWTMDQNDKIRRKKFKINETLTLWQNDTELNKDDLWAKLAEIKWNNLILEDTMKQTKARTGMKWTKQWKMCGYQMPKEEIGHKMSQNGWNKKWPKTKSRQK